MKTSSPWNSSIDRMLAEANARAVSHMQPTAKVASQAPAQEDEIETLLKEASQMEDALSYIADEDPSAGLSLSALLKQARASDDPPSAGKTPGKTETTTGGQQAEAPRTTGKPGKTETSGKRPKTTEAPGGHMPEMPLSQTPRTDPTQPVKAAEAPPSLYDLVLQKEAAAGKGPATTGALQGSSKTPSSAESRLRRLLATNTAPVNATKREAKAPTRERLREVLKNVNDGSNEAAARAAFPQAVRKGSLKIASSGVSYETGPEGLRRSAIRLGKGGLGGAALGTGFGGIAGALSGTPGGVTAGALGGGMAGGAVGMAGGGAVDLYKKLRGAKDDDASEARWVGGDASEAGLRGVGRTLKRHAGGAALGAIPGAALGGLVGATQDEPGAGALAGGMLGAYAGETAGALRDAYKKLSPHKSNSPKGK